MIGKVAVVTGGLSGIGLAAAKSLKSEGYRIVIGSRRCNTEKSSSFENLLGKSVTFFQLDVSNQKSVEAHQECRKKDRTPEILVNAAGIYEEAQIVDEIATTGITAEHKLNIAILMTKALMAGMIERNLEELLLHQQLDELEKLVILDIVLQKLA